MNPESNKKSGNKDSGSFSERDKSPVNNQKKSSNRNSAGQDTHRKSIFKTEYQKKIILHNDRKGDYFYCNICPGKPKLQRRNIDNHCLNSVTHENHVEEKYEKDHQELCKAIRDSMAKNKKNKDFTEEKEDLRNYLEFLAFCLKENLSFLQVSQIGKQLNKMALDNKVGFLKKYGFDREEIGKMTCSLGESLLKETKKILEESPFSLIIDNVTASNTGICGMQVRYLKEFQDNSGFQRYAIENKLIGLKYLEESSKSQVLFQAVKEKILDLGDKIKQNFIGLTHDKASVFTGEYSGLDTLLQKEKASFLFILKDPCHALNSALNKSLTLLPEEMKFIESICQHFSSSQREAKLLQIEKKNNCKELGVKKYLKIRWLSLGQTLARIIEIWDSILAYMKEKPYYPGVPKKNYDDWIKLLEDQTFKCKLICLSGIINKKVNKSNITWQKQTLEVQNINSEMNHCLKGIANLFLDPNCIPLDISIMKANNWDKEENLYEHFLPVEKFLKNLEREVDPNLKDVLTFETEIQNKFTETFQKYLAKLFSFMIFYLPVDDKIVKALDFLNLTQPLPILKENILYFNETFSIIPLEKVSDLLEEVNLLDSHEKVWMRSVCKESALHLWNLIEGTSVFSTGEAKYPLLSRIFRIAHSLPTSSACIEQSFSSLKLIKNNLRNQMNEKALESLILIQQEFRNGDITISDEMIQSYEEEKQSLRVRKSRSSLTQKVSEEMAPQENNKDEDRQNVYQETQQDLRNIENEHNLHEPQTLIQREEMKEQGDEEEKESEEKEEEKVENNTSKEVKKKVKLIKNNNSENKPKTEVDVTKKRYWSKTISRKIIKTRRRADRAHS